MIIEKLKEFAKNGQKNTDELDLEAGFAVNKKPARQWFNWLFNALTLKINEIIDADYIQHDEIADNLTTNDAKKPLSAKQGKGLQDNKINIGKAFNDAYARTLDFYLDRDLAGDHNFTSCADFPVGTRILLARNLNFADHPNIDDYVYIETKKTFERPSNEKPSKIQIAYGYTTGRMATRVFFTGVYGPWNFLAFENSNITGNAATASKLANQRTVSFSGAATGSFPYDGSANSSAVLTLANSGVDASTYGSNLKIPVITVNAKGLITGVSEREVTKASLSLDKFSQNPGNNTAIGAPIVDAAIIITDYGWGIFNNNVLGFDPALPLASGGTGRTDGKAHALVNPRKIFGQTFDGSSDAEGTVTASTGLLQSDKFHYIDLGRQTIDRMNFYNYGATFNFIDSQDGNVVARITQNGIDCNAATASKLKTARNIKLTGAVSGNADFDGSGNIQINATLQEGIGIGQTWKNVLSQRVINTEYTNTTPKPIMICIWQSTDSNPSLIVDGVIVASIDGSPGSVGVAASAIVPPASKYKVTAAVQGWVELS